MATTSERATAPLLRSDWQMRLGERAALEELLGVLRPRVAIELGTHRGGSLSRIAEHSEWVHTFDLTQQVDSSPYSNVTFHIGDSHVLLKEVLAGLHREGRTVQFALVDGDHSAAGARQDLVDLLASPAVTDGAIVFHDSGNEAVRAGMASVPFSDFPKVASVEFDFVPALRTGGRMTDGWGGFGLVLLDRSRSGPGATPDAAGGAADPWRVVRAARRGTRRQAGVLLRRSGLHPAQRRAKRNDASSGDPR